MEKNLENLRLQNSAFSIDSLVNSIAGFCVLYSRASWLNALLKKKIWSALRIKHKSVHTNTCIYNIYMLLCFDMYRRILNRIDTVFRILKITIQPFIFSFLQQPDFKIYIYDNFYSKFSDWKSPLPSFSLCARKVR